MRRVSKCLAALAMFLTASLAGGAAERSPPASPQPAERPRPVLSRPLFFVENAGQTDERVAFHARTPAGTVWFTPQGLTYGFVRETKRCAVKLDFVGAREDVVPEGHTPAPTVVSWLKGPREQWHAGLRTFREVVYRDLWPGIDLVYEANDGRLKYTFEVAAGADPSAIRFDVRGATECAPDAEHRLRIATPMGGLVDDRPVAWQETSAGRRDVEVAFDVAKSRVAFEVGAYDAALPLTIDPPVYVYSGVLGGDGNDFPGGIAVDAAGSAYLTGWTFSSETSFPVEAGFDMTYGGAEDAFVAKLTPAGDDFVYVTYLGGTALDIATDIEVDAGGNAFVCGYTSSSTTFPALVGPDVTYNGGFTDGFIVKLNPTGTALVYGGFIGGAGDVSVRDDNPMNLDLDDTGRAYVVGTTKATQATFPTAGGLDATQNGGQDAYVVVVAADGTAFEEAGFLGGAGNETGRGIAVGPNHSFYVCGDTNDGGASFPKTVGPSLAFGGQTDGFAACFSSAGALQWCGLWGGSFFDYCNAIDVDAAGRAYLFGMTGSTQSSFPLVDALDATANGNYDACIARVLPDGSAFDFSSFFGGAGMDEATDIEVTDGGVVHVVGSTDSHQSTFPVRTGDQPGPKAEAAGEPITFEKTGTIQAWGARLEFGGEVGGPILKDDGWFWCGYLTKGEGVNRVEAVAVSKDGTSVDYAARLSGTATDGIEEARLFYEFGDRKKEREQSVRPDDAVWNQKGGTPVFRMGGTLESGDAGIGRTTNVTVDVLGCAFDLPPAAGKGPAPSHVLVGPTDTVKFTSQLVKGTSKYAFTLEVKGAGCLAGKVDANGDVPVRITGPDLDVTTTVRLAGGKFKAGKGKGIVVFPEVALDAGKMTLKDGAKDKFAATFRVAHAAVPATGGPQVSLKLKSNFVLQLAPGDFKGAGTTRVAKIETPSWLGKVTADYKADTIRVEGHGLEIESPGDDGVLDMTIGVGGRETRFTPLAKATGSTLSF